MRKGGNRGMKSGIGDRRILFLDFLFLRRLGLGILKLIVFSVVIVWVFELRSELELGI